MNDDWQQRLDGHQQAVGRFVKDVEALDSELWEKRRAPDAWCPAQIAEHVLIVYEVAARELQGGSGMRIRTGFWWRTLLRWRYLPIILRDGRIPRGAKAVREVRPSETPRARSLFLEQFPRAAAVFESELANARDRDGHLTHAIFGKLSPRDALRFVAVHLESHRRQLDRDAEAGR